MSKELLTLIVNVILKIYLQTIPEPPIAKGPFQGLETDSLAVILAVKFTA